MRFKSHTLALSVLLSSAYGCGEVETEGDAGVRDAASADAGDPDATAACSFAWDDAAAVAGDGEALSVQLRQDGPVANSVVNLGTAQLITDANGSISSNSAPNFVSFAFQRVTLGSNDYLTQVTLLAPALGDEIVVEQVYEEHAGEPTSSPFLDTSSSHSAELGTFVDTVRVDKPAEAEPAEVALPKIDSLTLPTAGCGDGARLSWTSEGDTAQADAVAVVISLRNHFSSCCLAIKTWVIIAPPETHSVPLGFLRDARDPSGNRVLHDPLTDPLVVESITYLDSDDQHGYRDFLEKTIRLETSNKSSWAPTFVSQAPSPGGITRSARLEPAQHSIGATFRVGI